MRGGAFNSVVENPFTSVAKMAGAGPHKPSFQDSSKGSKILVDQDNFQYWQKSVYMSKKTAKSTEYYKCIMVGQGCPVRLKYSPSEDLVNSYSHLPHNHDSNILSGVVKNATKSFVKDGENKKPREVLKDLTEAVEKHTDGMGTDQLPSLASVGKQLQRARKKKEQLPPDPKSWSEWPKEVPEMLRKTARDEDFLLIYQDLPEDPAGKKIIGFASPTMLDLLSASGVWHGDGMFSAVNHLMVSQIYTILAETQQGITLPAAFFILPNKKKEIYKLMLQSLKDKIPSCGPKILHLDFEVGVVTACSEIFPEAKISYCHFHWLQAIKRNVGSRGLTVAQNRDASVQCYIRSLWTMIFFPPDMMIEAFNVVKEQMPKFEEDEDLNNQLQDFTDYFKNNFIRDEEIKPRFSRENLSKYNEILRDPYCPLDNNIAEAFNRQFAEALPKVPSIWGIIKQFAKEEAFAKSKWLKSISRDPVSQDNEKRIKARKKQRDALQEILKNLKEGKIDVEVAILKLQKYKDGLI